MVDPINHLVKKTKKKFWVCFRVVMLITSGTILLCLDQFHKNKPIPSELMVKLTCEFFTLSCTIVLFSHTTGSLASYGKRGQLYIE